MNRDRSDEMRDILELFQLMDELEDIMLVDVERGTIGLNVQTDEDVQCLATAVAKTKAVHNTLVAWGKIPGPPIS